MLKPVALGKNPSFENIILILYNIKSALKKEELIHYFKNIVFDFSNKKIPLFSSCFLSKKIHSFDFLRNPVKSEGKYFTSRNEQESLVAFFALNYQEVYAYMENVETFLSDKDEYAKIVIENYGKDFANQAVTDLNNRYSKEFDDDEKDKIVSFFNYYKSLIDVGKTDMAISLLILYTIINVNVIYLNDFIQEKVDFFYSSEIDLKCDVEYVICSVLNDDTFLTIEKSDEPLNEDDKTKSNRNMLFAQKRNFLTYQNSVFTFEAATETENIEDDTDNNFGTREFPISERSMSVGKIMNILISIGTSMFGNMPFKHSQKYYIKSSNGLYLSYIDWHTESRLVFQKEKTKKSRWFIDMDKDGSIVFTPSGGIQYSCFAMDIPNATQKTNMIPMWLFIKNNTKAQKYKLHRVKK